MSIITLETIIEAPIERCFLLSLSVDLHKVSAAQTNETAVDGITSGIMGANDVVTWEAKHFGTRMHMTTKISSYEKPTYFVSEMVKGPFKRIYHQHIFQELQLERTLMIDRFDFSAPFGILGSLAEKFFLTSYMKKFLLTRNICIKETAEGNSWQELLK